MTTKPPSGTRDFLPADIRRREHVVGVVRRVYEQYGYEPLETPAFEHIETLLGKYGEEGNKLIFKILRRGERETSGEADLALRYDLTVPLARVVAQYQNELPKFFKRYQIQPVWRADRPAKGRFREFFQCDIDSIGSTSAMVEVEQVSAVCEVLVALGFSDFQVRLNHRQLLAASLSVAGIAVERHGEALIIIDKLDKIGAQGVLDQLTSAFGHAAAADCLAAFAPVETSALDALDLLSAGFDGNEAGLVAVSKLREIVRLSQATPAAPYLRLDRSLARGLSYYTGAIMEISVPDLTGSLGGGGRYDNLVGMFLGRDVPACGFSLGLERIIVVMTERGMFEKVERGGVDVVVTFADEGARTAALSLAHDLRGLSVRSADIERRMRAETYPDISKKFDRVWKHASTRGAVIVASVGGSELPDHVGLRDIRIQQRIPSVTKELAASQIRDLVQVAFLRE